AAGCLCVIRQPWDNLDRRQIDLLHCSLKKVQIPCLHICLGKFRDKSAKPHRSFGLAAGGEIVPIGIIVRRRLVRAGRKCGPLLVAAAAEPPAGGDLVDAVADRTAFALDPGHQGDRAVAFTEINGHGRLILRHTNFATWGKRSAAANHHAEPPLRRSARTSQNASSQPASPGWRRYSAAWRCSRESRVTSRLYAFRNSVEWLGCP